MSQGPTLLTKGNLVSHKYSESHDELDKQIPIEYIMKWFNKRIPKNYGESIIAKSPADRILIVQSSTGSGKSTIIPPYLYHNFIDRLGKPIYCSQPRVLTAIDIPKNSIPKFNTKEELSKQGHTTWNPLIYGKNMATQTGPFTKRSITKKSIIYGTPGVLLQQLNIMETDAFMDKYGIIIIDEAHERSVQIDTLLYLLKKFININYQKNGCFYLIVMSATFNAEKV